MRFMRADLLLPTAESPRRMILRSGSGKLSVLLVSGDWYVGSSTDMLGTAVGRGGGGGGAGGDPTSADSRVRCRDYQYATVMDRDCSRAGWWRLVVVVVCVLVWWSELVCLSAATFGSLRSTQEAARHQEPFARAWANERGVPLVRTADLRRPPCSHTTSARLHYCTPPAPPPLLSSNNTPRSTLSRSSSPCAPSTDCRDAMRAAAARQAIWLARCTLTRPICPSTTGSAHSYLHLIPPPSRLLSLPALFCRHAHSKAGRRVRRSSTRYTLPAPASFPSLAAFTQHVVTARSTPAAVKSTLTSARSLLGPDAYELLISLLTAARPSAADIAAALAEVRPFAVEHEKERKQAKLRLVQSKHVQPGEQQHSDQLQPQLDERAIAQLQRALTNIAKHISPTPHADSSPTLSANEQQENPSPSPKPPSPVSVRPPAVVRLSRVHSSPTRLFLTQLSALLPSVHFQALLRCFLVHSTAQIGDLRRQERHLATLRDIVAAAALTDDKAWQTLYRQYKGLRRRGALDEAVCTEWMKEVDEAELRKLLPQAKEIEKLLQERRNRTTQQSESERREVDKREKVKEREAAAEQERIRLESIMGKAGSLSLPRPPPLLAFFPGSSVPIDAAALPASFLPPSDWSLAAMRCLEQLQAEYHPLTYWHFRSYMALLAAGPAAEMAAATSSSAVLSNVIAYCALLFPDSHLLKPLASQLPTFLHLSAPPPLPRKQASKPSPPLSSLASVPSFELPLERHAFLCHLHREAVPAQSSELFLSWWRWQLTVEEAERRGEQLNDEGAGGKNESGAVRAAEVDVETSEEMKSLDAEISRLQQRRRRRRRKQVDAIEAAASASSTADSEKRSAESKPRKEAVHSRLTVLNTATRLFGDGSPLVFLLRQHISALTFAEWSEVRLRLSAESDNHDYIGFFVDESSTAPTTPAVYHQRYNNPLLESNPALLFVHSPTPPAALSAAAAAAAAASSSSSSSSSSSPTALSAIEAFSSFRSSHSGSKLFLSNVPPDMSARELMFALRRIGEVKGGELFREKQRLSSTEREMLAERERREKAASSSSSSLLYAAGVAKKGHSLKVLKMAGDSPVYASVYFASAASLEVAHEPSLHLFGLQYRGRSIYPLPVAAITRLTLASPTLRHSFSFTHLVSHIVALIVPAVLPSPSHLSVSSRSTLTNNGYVTVTLRSHEEAARVWEKLRGELFAGRRVRCSWAWEDRDKVGSSRTREHEKEKQPSLVELEGSRDDVRKVREADIVVNGAARQRMGEMN